MQQDVNAYVDLDTGLGRVRGNKTLYRKMLDLFLKSTEFEALDQSLEAKDYAAAADVAHAIKGMTGNLALTRLFELSTALMNALRAGDEPGALVQEYRDVLENTRQAVRQVAAELDAG